MIGCRAPRAGRPDDSRLNQMFGQTVNRCQATPIVVCRPITTNQAIEMMILIAATATTPVARLAALIPEGNTNQVRGKCTRDVSSPSSRNSIARIKITQITMPRMVSST